MKKEELPKNHPFQDLLRMRSAKNVDQIFDLVCFQNYISGQFDNKIPVAESRLLFEHIKSLLKKV